MKNKLNYFLKNTIFSNWSFIRAVRLFLAILILAEAFRSKEMFFAIAGGLFFIQSVFNWGCCGIGACSSKPGKRDSSEIPGNITYEEIKGGK